jgi:hypothetical protein
MTAKSTKGLQVHMNRADVTPTTLVPSAITKAAPAVATVTSTTGMVEGELVTMLDTGFTELDGKTFVIGAVTGTTFELMGTDLTGSSGTLAGSPKANYYKAADMVLLCLATLTPNVNEPGTVSTATFCDPTTSIPSAVNEAGTLTMTGFVDITSQDYQQILLAEADGVQRALRVTLPSNGYLVCPFTVSTISWDLPTDGAIGYTLNSVMGSKMKHVF